MIKKLLSPSNETQNAPIKNFTREQISLIADYLTFQEQINLSHTCTEYLGTPPR